MYFWTMFSGGFLNDVVNPQQPRVASSATSYNQYSWAMDNLLYDEYLFHWTAAIKGEDAFGSSVDADYNNDGHITMDEAFYYAESHDEQFEPPQYQEHPVEIGSQISLGDVLFPPTNIVGTVVYNDFEGGFYGIVGDDGNLYDPINLAEDFKIVDMRVRFSGLYHADGSFHMWGCTINITEICEIIEDETGEIVFNDFEGGFYGIIGDDGNLYDPINLPILYQIECLQISFSADIINQSSYHMWGSVIELTDISTDQITLLAPYGLQGMNIRSIEVTENYIYAGTEQDGLYRKNISCLNCDWEYLDSFDGKSVEAICAYSVGAEDIVYIGLNVFEQINPLLTVEIHSLYFSDDSGDTFVSRDNGLEEFESYTGINYRLPVFDIERKPGDNNIIYCTSLYHTFKSNDDGLNWYSIDSNWGIFGYKRHVISISSSNPDIILVGGETNMYSGYVKKSIDGGETWAGISPDMGGDNACYNIIINPDYPDIIYAGMEGAILKTTDGGENWRFDLQPTPGAYIRGLVFNPEDPNHIFAGGDINGGNDIKIWEKYDGELVQPFDPYWYYHFEEGAGAINEIVYDPVSLNIIYIGTENGVYQFWSNWNGSVPQDDNIE